LPSGGKTAGNFDAHHLHAGLALAVDAMFEAKRAEFIFRDFTRDERRGFLAEDLNLPPNGIIVLILKGFALR
jgi:hypothetical protein